MSAIKHKMGIEGSATCVLDFDQACAWRIAGQGAGSSGHMAAMFLLMNHARLGTAISGIAYADMAHSGRRMGVCRDVLLASVERCIPLPAIADLAQRLRQGLERLAQAHEDGPTDALSGGPG